MTSKTARRNQGHTHQLESCREPKQHQSAENQGKNELMNPSENHVQQPEKRSLRQKIQTHQSQVSVDND
jgi:hypothetical protein